MIYDSGCGIAGCKSQALPVRKYGVVSAMLRRVGTLNTYSSLAVFVNMSDPYP